MPLLTALLTAALASAETPKYCGRAGSGVDELRAPQTEASLRSVQVVARHGARAPVADCGRWLPAAAGATWACPDGTRAVLSQDSGLWAAVSLIVSALGAGGADLTWMERGVPRRLFGPEQHSSDPARLRGVPGQVIRPRGAEHLRPLPESGLGAPEL